VFLKLSAGQLEASGNLLLTPQKSEGEFSGKSGFPGQESSWYKLLIGRGNPEIKVHLPIIPDFRNHYLEVALGCTRYIGPS